MDELRYIRFTAQGAVTADEGSATHVLMPLQTLRELRGSEGESVTIPRSEYNGLLKALRIVNDRALQQIDRAKADEHGYTLLDLSRKRLSVKAHGRERQAEVRQLVYRTPHSLHLGWQDAEALILAELRQWYGFREPRSIRALNGQPCTEEDVVLYAELAREPEELRDEVLKGYLQREFSGHFPFSLRQLSADMAAGVYKLTLYST